MDHTSPRTSVCHYFLPLWDLSQVSADDIQPPQAGPSWPPLLSSQSAPQQLLLWPMVWHPLQVSDHWSLFNLSCSLSGSSPVSSSMSTLCRISHRVTPTMSWRHLICKAFSLLMSCWVTVQVSAPYSDHCPKHLHLGSSAEASTPEHLLAHCPTSLLYLTSWALISIGNSRATLFLTNFPY